MLLTFAIPGRGSTTVAIDFNTQKWIVTAGETAWSGIGATKGTFRLSDGPMFLNDPTLKANDPNIVIVHAAPTNEADDAHASGTGRIYKPQDSALQDGTLRWTAAMSPVRKAILDICANNLPPKGHPCKEPPNCIASKVDTGYTNCGSFPGYVAKKLGYYVPWDQGAKLHAQILKTKGDKAQAIWEQTQKMLKITEQEYKYKIDDKEAKINVAGSGASFTAPMAAGWGVGQAYEYPVKLEKLRNLDPGTIWIPFGSGKRAQPGDFYVLKRIIPKKKKDSPSEIGFGHVGVIVDTMTNHWWTADGGQGAAGFAVGYQRRKFTPDTGDLILDPPLKTEQDDGWRQLEGWVNADQLFWDWKG